jgi:hypothetical protein
MVRDDDARLKGDARDDADGGLSVTTPEATDVDESRPDQGKKGLPPRE